MTVRRLAAAVDMHSVDQVPEFQSPMLRGVKKRAERLAVEGA